MASEYIHHGCWPVIHQGAGKVQGHPDQSKEQQIILKKQNQTLKLPLCTLPTTAITIIDPQQENKPHTTKHCLYSCTQSVNILHNYPQKDLSPLCMYCDNRWVLGDRFLHFKEAQDTATAGRGRDSHNGGYSRSVTTKRKTRAETRHIHTISTRTQRGRRDNTRN